MSADEHMPGRCNHDGGQGVGAAHRCRCVRQYGHDVLVDPRPHGCPCGHMWAADKQEKEFRRHERDSLARRVCPHSGEPLTDHGDGVPGSLSCALCDCFGYQPEEVGRDGQA